MSEAEKQKEFEVTVKCANCNSTYTFSSTTKDINIEICGRCHPFYSGKESLVDTAGRIEKFQSRLAKTSKAPVQKKTKTKARKAKLSIADLTQSQEKSEKPKMKKKVQKEEVKTATPKTEPKEVKIEKTETKQEVKEESAQENKE